MKENMDTEGLTQNATMIIQLKKMFNNLRKYYELNMTKAFLTINNYSRMTFEGGMSSLARSRNTSEQSFIYRHDDSFSSINGDNVDTVRL